jgi:cytochrome b pre-mRNA-processing protein 3
MFERWKQRRRNREIVDALYAEIVERARQPRLFSAIGVADTVMGRFEVLAIHMFLALARLRREPELAGLAQELVDRFVLDIDHSIRELGVGDQSVPKRMRKLTGVFYERVAAYDLALETRTRTALAQALAGRALPAEDEDAAGRLAAYMLEENSRLAELPAASLLAGRFSA